MTDEMTTRRQRRAEWKRIGEANHARAVAQWEADNPAPYHYEGPYLVSDANSEVHTNQPKMEVPPSIETYFSLVANTLHGSTNVTDNGAKVRRVSGGNEDAMGDAFEIVGPWGTMRFATWDYNGAAHALAQADVALSIA
jgi:hypothetical protein